MVGFWARYGGRLWRANPIRDGLGGVMARRAGLITGVKAVITGG